MNTLAEAISQRAKQQQDAQDDRDYADACAWEDDPRLEEMGRRLDLLREHDPASHDAPSMGYARQEIANYRRRKADAAHIAASRGGS